MSDKPKIKIVTRKMKLLAKPVKMRRREKNEAIKSRWNELFPQDNRTLYVGPPFSGETHLLFKILSRIPDRDFYIITKSPP